METFSIAAGLPAQERAGRLGSELFCSVIDSQTKQNLIRTAIQPVPVAKK